MRRWIAAAFWLGLAANLSRAGMQPPDFSRMQLADSAEKVEAAWTAWDEASSKLERDIGKLSVKDAESRVRLASASFQAYVEARRLYAETVASGIENSEGLEPVKRIRIPQHLVNADQLNLLGAMLTKVQSSLNELRDAPYWTKVRRAVQPQVGEIAARQSYLMAKMPVAGMHEKVDVLLYGAADYRESERRTREQITALWTTYYYTLGNSVIQGESAVSSGADSEEGAWFRGNWRYVSGAEFQGAGEPKEVTLELRIDGGLVEGRYRARLPDSDGVKDVDLQLRGKPSTGTEQKLDFRSSQWGGDGKIVLRRTGPNGSELTLIRLVGRKASVPKGSEVLTRK